MFYLPGHGTLYGWWYLTAFPLDFLDIREYNTDRYSIFENGR